MQLNFVQVFKTLALHVFFPFYFNDVLSVAASKRRHASERANHLSFPRHIINTCAHGKYVGSIFYARACKSNSLDTNNSRTNLAAWRNDISALYAQRQDFIFTSLYVSCEKNKYFAAKRYYFDLKIYRDSQCFSSYVYINIDKFLNIYLMCFISSYTPKYTCMFSLSYYYVQIYSDWFLYSSSNLICRGTSAYRKTLWDIQSPHISL